MRVENLVSQHIHGAFRRDMQDPRGCSPSMRNEFELGLAAKAWPIDRLMQVDLDLISKPFLYLANELLRTGR